ncbi:hypothetical protein YASMINEVIRUS_1384 [Yasminevirus sp. GU-2018]|uniref:Uncharacterized protein n=1 Tax=Yasminevirus sp. GU-2018 TaxID=2420051 RepID=A0A5K0UB80_9VIRU|nr:hypothetical protein YASMINEVIRUS_1384 [Yasminevirus sp. GU-2018]
MCQAPWRDRVISENQFVNREDQSIFDINHSVIMDEESHELLNDTLNEAPSTYGDTESKTNNINVVEPTNTFYAHKSLSNAYIQDIESAYSIMANGAKVLISNRIDDCIHQRRTSINSNVPHIIMYAGLCKPNQLIQDLRSNGINYVVAYNTREIKMLETKGVMYLVKVKLSNHDIGVSQENLIGALASGLQNFQGICMTLSKKWVIDYVYEADGRRIAPSSRDTYRTMNGFVVNLIQSIQPVRSNLNFFIIDVQDENDSPDNSNQSNVMFKMSIFNYLRDAGFVSTIVS